VLHMSNRSGNKDSLLKAHIVESAIRSDNTWQESPDYRYWNQGARGGSLVHSFVRYCRQRPSLLWTSVLRSCSGLVPLREDPSFINPSIPSPSHQIASNFTSSSFLRHTFTAQTYYQNSLRWPCFLLYCSYSLEFA